MSTEGQDKPPMFTEPRTEHRWLEALVGEWTYEAEADMGPDKPPERATGTERVRSLGGLWVVAEGQGTMPGGGAATTLMTVGYDPRTGRYVGTWIGSMMAHLWIYDGELDAAGRILTLEAEGPHMTVEGKLARYRDVIELEGPDHRLLRSRMVGDDGEWREFMVAHYRRKR